MGRSSPVCRRACAAGRGPPLTPPCWSRATTRETSSATFVSSNSMRRFSIAETTSHRTGARTVPPFGQFYLRVLLLAGPGHLASLAAQRQHVVDVLVRARDDVDANDFADRFSRACAGFCRRLH